MKPFRIILLVAITTCLTFSCGEDDSEPELLKEGGSFKISELAGNWEATTADFFRASDGLKADIIADRGSVSLTVQSSGRCTFTIEPDNRDAYTVSGEMFWSSFEGDDAIAVVWDGNPDDRSSFRWFEITDTTFDLGCTSECGEYDFNNDGTTETADISFSFIRK